MNTIQDIVEEVGKIVIKPERQYKPGDRRPFGLGGNNLDGQTYELKFEQLHVYQKPTYKDQDRVTHNIFPNEARLRNLTYESEIFMDVRTRIFNQDPDTNEERTVKNVLAEKIPIGKIPVMVRSKYCALNGLTDRGKLRLKDRDHQRWRVLLRSRRLFHHKRRRESRACSGKDG